MKYEIAIMGREDAEETVHDKPYAVISITDPQSENARIRKNGNLKGLLRLKFHDITQRQIEIYQEHDSEREFKPITRVHAASIARFVKKMSKEVKAFIIHCEAGISRSSGTAAAISLYLNGDDSQIWEDPRYHPNTMVYNMVLKALGLDHGYEEEEQERSATKHRPKFT